ncbi:G patch domain-containing protein 4 [Mortierella alpina]|uniref:G patch domain-containing protein 4 n=1 Tax=Mortierella alpina TaxID=64518 RepID=A0A9P6JEQ0_MORAP|nr:G patch domain-containing protein 4 [Mortierella alpina]
MSFAEKQLAKFGWKSGEGLGKNKDGIKKSISVTKKNDTKGLGGKLDKWDFAWWDHVFNKSAANIQVNKDESGEVKVEKQNASDIQVSRMGIISTSRPAGPSRSAASTASSSPATSSPSTMSSMVTRDEYADEDSEEKPAPVAKSGPSWLFGFVKASASSAMAEDAKKTNKDFTTSAASFAARSGAEYEAMKSAEGDEYRDYTIKVTDQELFQACEGRTARKGARGEQPGKLGRVTKELLVDDGSAELSSGSSKGSKKSKKEAKEKKAKKVKKEKKDKSDKKEMRTKKEKKSDKRDRTGKEAKEKKSKKETEDRKEKKAKSTEIKEKKVKKEKKEMKDKKIKEDKKSKKRDADEAEERPAKKSKKSKSE